MQSEHITLTADGATNEPASVERVTLQSGADKSAKPTSDDMRLAAEWLEQYEDADSEACKRVAAWLSEQADAKDLRDAAREHGVPVNALRRKLAAQS